MAQIHINIGSNQQRRLNIKRAIEAIKLVFSHVQISSIYESPSEGFSGDDFFNLGVNATTNLSPSEVAQSLRKIEQEQGRDRSQPKFSSRNIDLDLVFYDQLIDHSANLPRDDILKYAFVLAPLCEINPDTLHPVENKSYSELWSRFQSENSYRLQQYNKDEILGESV